MTGEEIEAPLKGELVSELRDWASLWGDLLHVDMVLLARDRLPNDASNVFARRGLWEGAVIAYARTAISGRRRQQVGQLLSVLGADAEACHEEVMAWRNQHAAHRVDPSREKTEVRAILDPKERRVERIGIRVAPVVGPEEEGGGLVARFQSHVKALRDLTWVQRIQPLEDRVRSECASDVDALMRIAKAPAPAASSGFSIDISPSGKVET